MAGMRMLVAVMLGLSLFAAVALGFETEVKLNNYPNFEFRESPASDTAEVKPHNYPNFQFSASNDKTDTREYKPNNYPNFEFTESPGYGSKSANHANRYDYDKSFSAVPDARDRFPSSDNRFSQSNSPGQENYVYDASHVSQNSFSAVPSAGDLRGDSFFSTDMPSFSTELDGQDSSRGVYKGSDSRGRYASSYDLISSRKQASHGYDSFSSSEAQFNTVQQPGSRFDTGSSRFYSPATDPAHVFRFAMPDNIKPENNFGSNSFRADKSADGTVFSQFTFANSDATNDPSATYGRTSPVLAANNIKKRNVGGGQGCANMYWAEHIKQWPSFFNIHTQVAQAFGTKAGSIFGTTTLLQALYDNRPDGYSKLLSQGTASLLNAYAKPNYAYRHDAVIDQFLAALYSRTAAGVQAQKFQNANQAYGPNDCLN